MTLIAFRIFFLRTLLMCRQCLRVDKHGIPNFVHCIPLFAHFVCANKTGISRTAGPTFDKTAIF